MRQRTHASERGAGCRTAYVISSGNSYGGDIAAGLAEQGMQVALISDENHYADSFVDARFDSFAALEDAFSRAEKGIGSPDLVVACIAPAAARQPKRLDQYTDENWTAYCQVPLKGTLYSLQAAGKAMSQRGGAVVVLGPSVGYTGTASLVALSSLVEGQRGLAKAAARQLGSKGITVNWLALSSTRLYPELSQAALPQVPEMGPPPLPLGDAPGLDQILPMLTFLGSPGARILTGANLMVDGGEWMLP